MLLNSEINIKLLKVSFLLLLNLLIINAFSQTNCAGAAPFCAGTSGVTFPASTGTTSQPGPNYGCLFSQPNPAWYYFQVSTSGLISINIAGTGGGDVDFICWGPFTNAIGNCGNLTAGNTVGCSYSASPTETCTIAGAIAGQFYMLLITNFSGMSQNIAFGLSSSSVGSTNCGLLGSGVTSKTICPGSTAILTATTSLISPSYTWMPGGLTTNTIAVSPATTSVYSVTIAGTNTVTSLYNSSVKTSTVTVLTNPYLSFVSNGTICAGSPINLMASSGYTNYIWSGPPAFSSTTTATSMSIPNAISNMAGTYTLLVRSAQGCTNTATASVGIVQTSSVATTPSYTICEGGYHAFNSTFALGASYYKWIGPSGFISASQNPTITSVSPLQTGIYTVTACFVSGTSTCTTQNTTTLIVVPAIPSSLPVIPTVCSNGTINLNAPSGGSAYSWNGPNSFSSSLQNATINNAGTINNGTYTVTITTGLCVNVGTVNVSVFNPISFSSLPSNTVICFAKNALLSASAIGGSGLLSYSWSPASGLTNPNSYNTVVNGISSTNYSVSVSDVNCPMTISPLATAFVTVNPTPVISMTTSNSRGCEPFYTDLIGTSVPTSTNCQWRFSNHLGFGSCNAPSYCFPTNGVYGATLTVTDINGCVDSTKNSSFVLVDPKPTVDFGWTPDNPTVLINEVSFYDQSTVGLPITNWHWDFGDMFTTLDKDSSNVANPSHIYDNPFSYSITLAVTNSFGCKDTLIKILKVDDEFALFIPKAFTPNHLDGVNDVFKVSGVGFLVESFQMEIFDRWGELIFKTNDINKGWDGAIKGNKTLKQETYIYKIKLRDFKNKVKEFEGHLTLL